MPLPNASLLTIDLQLRNVPHNLPEHEKQRLIALTAINYGGSLGRAVSFLSASKLCEPDAIQMNDPDDHLDDLDSALFTLGDLQACFMDAAYAAVEEMFIALNNPPPDEPQADVNESVSAEPGLSQPETPVGKTGRAKISYQSRNAATGCYVSQPV